MSWPKIKLQECVKFISGGTPHKNTPEYWMGDIPWVSSGEMTEPFIHKTALNITKEGVNAGSRLVPKGTIFIVVRGMSLATEFRVSYACRDMAFNQDLKALLVKKEIDSYFLFCALRANAKNIRDLSTEAGHGTKKLEMTLLENYEIQVPDITTQIKVASIIRCYDDLIQTNQQRIALLEEAAQRLYDEWFVKLRFPNHEQVPVVEGVPEGWRIKKVGDVIPFQYGKSLKADSRIDGEYPVYGSSGIVGYHTHALIAENCIIVGRKGNAGSVFFSSIACFPIDTVFYIEPSKANFYFYFFLKGLVFVDTDSAVPGLNRNYAHNLNVLIPDSSILEKFTEKAELFFKQISILEQENQKLTQARDELLPRLMSGQLDISKLT